jgi:predicted O-methyltransferase YrrM
MILRILRRMTKRDEPLAAIPDPKVRALLARLHRQADRETPRMLWQLKSLALPALLKRKLPWAKIEHRLDDKFIALDRSQGVLCYLLARALAARRIVEFGTSFGVSTIYLALAVRDNGGGRVYGTEKIPAKAARAREHLREAGLLEHVEILEGDARETLRDVEGPIDLLLNDGFPRYALDVLRLVSPRLRTGALVVTDNVGAFRADYADYVAWIRDPANGFCSSLLALNEGTEVSVRVAA